MRGWISNMPSVLKQFPVPSNEFITHCACFNDMWISLFVSGRACTMVSSSATRPISIDLANSFWRVSFLKKQLSSNREGLVGFHGLHVRLVSVKVVHLSTQVSQVSIYAIANQTQSPFLLQEQPTTSLARPPVGVQSKAPQYSQWTAVWEWENTVEISPHCLQITSMKKELGVWTNLLSLCKFSSCVGSVFKRSISIVPGVLWANIYLIIMHHF